MVRHVYPHISDKLQRLFTFRQPPNPKTPIAHSPFFFTRAHCFFSAFRFTDYETSIKLARKNDEQHNNN